MTDQTVRKLEKDGQIGVVISPGYGAGWSTWNREDGLSEFMAMDAEIVQAVLDGDKEKAVNIVLSKCGEKYVCTLGSGNLVVEWITKGQRFRISEYDGCESIEICEDVPLATA